MSAQTGDQLYSYESVRRHIDSAPTVGGPPIPELPSLQATGCTGGSIDLYNQVQCSVDLAIATEGPNVGSVGQAAVLAEAATQPPISCMVDLITGQYSDCDVEIPSDKRKAAYKAFTEVTGYKPVNLSNAFNHITNQEKKILTFNAFYMFFPIFLLSLIIIWLMVGFGWINWVVGLFLTTVSFVVLYGFSVAYRIHGQTYLNNQGQELQRDANNDQNNFENSIAYWPQGLFAVACAVTATGSTGSWTCNEPGDCANCPPVSVASARVRKAASRVCGSAEPEADQEQPKHSRTAIKKRVLRRKKN